MKEENNETATRSFPTEAEMNDMYSQYRLDFYADAQADKQEINRAYAIMVNKYGNYKKIPYGVKELLKKNYNAHEAKWGENGTEMQKRFGAKGPEPTTDLIEAKEQAKQEFLQEMQEEQIKQQSHLMEYER